MQDCQKKEHSDFTRTQMKKETILCELKKQGRRVTKQRKILLDIILEEQCSCCKEIYYEAIKKDATVRTINGRLFENDLFTPETAGRSA